MLNNGFKVQSFEFQKREKFLLNCKHISQMFCTWIKILLIHLKQCTQTDNTMSNILVGKLIKQKDLLK